MLSAGHRGLPVLTLLACLARWLAMAPLLALALLLSVPARAQPPQPSFQAFPFAQVLDIDAVRQVTTSAPGQVVAAIRRRGLEVLRVPAAPGQPINPELAALAPAPPALLQQAGFRDSYEGLLVHGGAACCDLPCDTVLIRASAPTYTLIHEFVQSLLRPMCALEPDDSVEVRFGAAFRRLVLYQRRLFDDPYKLLDPLWRRDILAAQADVARDLYGRIRLGQSQEAIVEKLLSLHIDERSPHFDAARREQGLRYGERMIDNAIDVFNELQASVAFVAETVQHLRQALRDGSIEPGEQTVALDDADLAAMRAAVRDIEARMDPVRLELQALKQFFTR